MCNEYVMKAREWVVALINREFRGVGDTIEAATHRVGRKYGVPAKTLTRVRHRAHDMKDMKVSVWFSIRDAYLRACDTKDTIIVSSGENLTSGAPLTENLVISLSAATKTSLVKADNALPNIEDAPL